MKFKSTLIVVLTLLSMSSPNFGQQAKNNAYFTYSAVAWSKSIHGKLYVKEKEGYAPLNVYTSGRTPERTYLGPNPMLFYGKFPGSNGLTEYRPIAQASIPIESNQVLLIFKETAESDKSDSSTYDVAAIDDSQSIFPRNSYRFINWSGEKIAGKLGNEVFVLPPKTSKTIQAKQTDKNTLQIQLIELKDDKNSRIYSANWYYQPNTRKLVFLTETQRRNKKRIKVKVIADYMAPAP